MIKEFFNEAIQGYDYREDIGVIKCAKEIQR
jgi:hypothetical protein